METIEETGFDTPIMALSDRVVILVDPAEEYYSKSAGIVVPEPEKKPEQKGTIVHVGSEVVEARPGMRVIFNKYAGMALNIEEKDYRVIVESEIVAVLARE